MPFPGLRLPTLRGVDGLLNAKASNFDLDSAEIGMAELTAEFVLDACDERFCGCKGYGFRLL